MATRARPTHFISLPLHRHAPFTARCLALLDCVTSAKSWITRVHPSMLQPIHRLHLTLGVMSLSTSSSSGAQNGSVSDEDVDKDLDAAKPQQRSSNRTVERAVALLQELRPSLLAEIAKLSHFPASASSGSLTSDTSSRGPLLATFRSVGMFEDSWNAKKRRKGHGGAVEASDCARVMFAKPQEDADEHGQTLRRISGQPPTACASVSLLTSRCQQTSSQLDSHKKACSGTPSQPTYVAAPLLPCFVAHTLCLP